MCADKVVLIVDDDPAVLETMRILLEGKGGYRVNVALGSHGASHCLDSIGALDVLIADVILAGDVTGIDICKQVLEKNPCTAVVVISADARSESVVLPPQSVYLRKPFGGLDLIAAIGEAERRSMRSHDSIA